MSSVFMVGEGDSSVLKVANGLILGGTTYSVIGSIDRLVDHTVSNVKFENFCIDGNSANNQGNVYFHLSLLAIQHGFDIVINNMLFKNCNGWNPVPIGDSPNFTHPSGNVVITNCRFENIANDPSVTDCSIIWVAADGIVISNNIFSGYADAVGAPNIGGCIEIHGSNVVIDGNQAKYTVSNFITLGQNVDCTNIVVSNNVVDHIRSFGDFAQTGNSFVPWAGSHLFSNVKIVDNVIGLYANNIEDTMGIGFSSNADGYTYDNIEISGNTFTVEENAPDPSYPTIFIWSEGNLTNLRMERNTFIGGNYYGMYFSFTQMWNLYGTPFAFQSTYRNSNNVIIRDNIMINPGLVGVLVGTRSDVIDKHTEWCIENNYMTDTNVSPALSFGIWLQACISTLYLNGNVINNTTTSPIRLTAVGAGFSDVKPISGYGSGAPPSAGGAIIYGYAEGSTYNRTSAGNGGLYVLHNGAWQELTGTTVSSNLTFDTTVSTPNLRQEDCTAPSTDGQTMGIHAQNATGTASTGGSLYLIAGTGTSAPGAIIAYAGATPLIAFSTYGLSLYQSGIAAVGPLNIAQTVPLTDIAPSPITITAMGAMPGAVTNKNGAALVLSGGSAVSGGTNGQVQIPSQILRQNTVVYDGYHGAITTDGSVYTIYTDAAMVASSMNDYIISVCGLDSADGYCYRCDFSFTYQRIGSATPTAVNYPRLKSWASETV